VRQWSGSAGVDRRRYHDMPREILLYVVLAFALEALAEVDVREYTIALRPRVHPQVLMSPIARSRSPGVAASWGCAPFRSGYNERWFENYPCPISALFDTSSSPTILR
jgi:hypothetical protein